MTKEQPDAVSAMPSAFTLIELLVVMSIIMMLMSIMLPSLNRAREMGHRVVCQSNIRNLTLAWSFYATDNNEQICSAETGWNTAHQNYWVADGPDSPLNTIGGTEQAIKDGVLWPYTDETLGIYKCRADASERLRSYAISRAMNGTVPQAAGGFSVATSTIQVKGASRKMVFIGADSVTKWIDGSFCPMEEPGAVPPVWYRRPSRNITARHADGVNLSFADYHCDWIRYKDPRTSLFAGWQITTEQASPDNVDLQNFVSMMTVR